jgi:nucleotide-binding universal stress UspA family protein
MPDHPNRVTSNHPVTSQTGHVTSGVMFTNVLVGVDHHEGGRDAIALAKRLQASDGALTLAHVYVEEPIVYRGVSAQYEASQRQDDLERLIRASEESGVRAELRWCRASSVGRGLHELCEQIGADLLVVGASRRGPPARALLGDDTHTAVEGSSCVVAVAPVGYSERLSPRES